MAKNDKTRFFYALYSDKTRVFDQSERAYYPIYIINVNINIYKYIYIYFFIFLFWGISLDHLATTSFKKSPRGLSGS